MKHRSVVCALATVIAGSAMNPPAPAAAWHSTGHPVRPGAAAHETMSDEEMRRLADAWWAAHPRTGTPSTKAANATFTVTNFRFDLDGSGATQVDTARIEPGESVTWQWVTGIHTVTSGTGSTDPQVGQLFNQPIDSGSRQFTFVFEDPGTYRFFCSPHEFLTMRGVVVVSSTTDVGASPSRAHGFTLDPAPNPTRDVVRFGFAMRAAGRARAEVYDARGRRVARVIDRELAAGPHEGLWDGRASDGSAVRAGVYYVRLRLPGYTEGRSVVLIR